jgi:hypothetical protein
VRRDGLTGEAARFAREWRFAFALVAATAAMLLATGQRLAGSLAAVLGAAAVGVRWSAMRKQGRGFWGQEKHSR